jgi:hypothetical protein
MADTEENCHSSNKPTKSKKSNKCTVESKLETSSPEEIARWLSALKEENSKLKQRVKVLEDSQKSESNSDKGREVPAKAPNGSLSAAYGFVGSRVRPKDAAKAEVWGVEAAPAALKEVEGEGDCVSFHQRKHSS